MIERLLGVESEPFSLLIHGGRLIDPKSGLDAIADIGIRAGRIVEVGPGLSAKPAIRRVDAAGLIVVPGLIDLHCHVYEGTLASSTNADAACLPFGVTTAVDMGTSGANTYAGLRRWIIDQSRVQLLAFLNLGAAGFATLPTFGELADQRLIRIDHAADVARADSDHIRGIKVRLGADAIGDNDARAVLTMATRLGDELGLPVMVHIAGADLPIPAVLTQLRPGDLVTHIFNAGQCSALTDDGIVEPAVWAAAERGVLFDTGHGGWHFDLDIARRATAQNLMPTTITTDVWSRSSSAVARELPLYSLPALVSLYSALGMSLIDALRATTLTPATVLGIAHERGHLSVGAVADVALYRLQPSANVFRDNNGHELDVSETLESRMTIIAGEVVDDPIDAYPFTDAEWASEGADFRSVAAHPGVSPATTVQ